MDSFELIITEVGVKTKSKVEIYRLLTTEDRLNLPPAKYVNFKILLDIITGAKKVYNCARFDDIPYQG